MNDIDGIKDFFVVVIASIIAWILALTIYMLSLNYQCAPKWVSVSDRNPIEINMYYTKMIKDNNSYFFSIVHDNQGWKNPYKNYTVTYWLEDNCWSNK
jgi:hypothetical protein